MKTERRRHQQTMCTNINTKNELQSTKIQGLITIGGAKLRFKQAAQNLAITCTVVPITVKITWGIIINAIIVVPFSAMQMHPVLGMLVCGIDCKDQSVAYLVESFLFGYTG
jgi:hypothetical protein